MTQDDIKQMLIEITDKKYNRDNSPLELAASDFAAAIINSVEDIVAEAIYQTLKNDTSNTM